MIKKFSVSFAVCILLLLFSGFVFINGILAVEKSATPSGTSKEATFSGNTRETDQVKSLKDKLATQVAQLREDQMRGFYGEISAVSKTSFTISTAKEEVKVRFSEDTVIFSIQSSKRIDVKTDALKNGLQVAVLGLFDKNTNIQTAKMIFIQSLPTRLAGEVTQVDKTNATFTLKNNKGKETTFDYEKTTKAQEFVNDSSLSKSGLSRLLIGDFVEVWTTASDEDKLKLKSVRLVRYPKSTFDKSEIKEDTTTNPAKSSPSPTK